MAVSHNVLFVCAGIPVSALIAPNQRLKPTLRVGAELRLCLFLVVHQFFSQGGLGFPLCGASHIDYEHLYWLATELFMQYNFLRHKSPFAAQNMAFVSSLWISEA